MNKEKYYNYLKANLDYFSFLSSSHIKLNIILQVYNLQL